jgi:hypothetical protein
MQAHGTPEFGLLAVPLPACVATPFRALAGRRVGRRRIHRLVHTGESEMRLIAALALACLMVACADIPRPPGPSCATPYECEIQGYARAGN